MWRLRSRLFEHIIHQEVGFFDRVRTGELMNRLSEVTPLRSRCYISTAKHSDRVTSAHCNCVVGSRSLILPSWIPTCQLMVHPAAASDLSSCGQDRRHYPLCRCVPQSFAF